MDLDHPASGDRPWRLLCLSNGHGEDAIAVQILQALARRPDGPEVAVLPLVGEGDAYRRTGFASLGPARQLPSGGFIYMDGGRQLLRDVRGGLVALTRSQLRTVRAWGSAIAQDVRPAAVLAVGDIVPLLFAAWSGAPYGFVGTAKSEYYLRDDDGKFLGMRRLEGWSGSVYLPWERWLMGRSRCRAIFPRDDLTAQILSGCLGPRSRAMSTSTGPVFNCGNPMMDGFEVPPNLPKPPAPGEPVEVLLLPGSRSPEAYGNWARILVAVAALLDQHGDRPWRFLAAPAPSLELERLADALRDHGWQCLDSNSPQSWHRDRATLNLASDRFIPWAERCHLAIATTGTATEQVVGLGKPAFTLPGDGPQFTAAFAEAQTRLLGPPAIACNSPEILVNAVNDLLNNPDRWHRLAAIGRRRLGPPGAADRIAHHLCQTFGANR